MKLLKQIIIILLLLKGTEVCAQHGIGTNDANPNAVLDVNATDKGVLLPRIALTSSSSLLPVTGTASNAHNGMTVYNTNPAVASGLVGVGYYFWSGGATGNWKPMVFSDASFNPGDLLKWNGSNWEPDPPTDTYSVFSIWAEENSNLNNNTYEWSFGNGSETLASQGVPIPVSAELFAIGVSIVSANATSIDVVVNGAVVATSNPYTGTGAAITNLLTPISITAGDLINFKTNLAGSASNGKVVAWFRTGTFSGISSNDLIDVDTTTLSPSTNDFLQRDGTQWVVATPDPDLNDMIDDLSDVDTTTNPPLIGDYLQWNGTLWVPFTRVLHADINVAASISNASTINFNSSITFTDQPLANIDFNEFGSDVTPDGIGFTIQTAGTYHITYAGLFTSTGIRATTITRINAGGNLGGVDFAYIRNISVNQGATSGSMVVQLNANDTVRLQSRQEGGITSPVNTDGIGTVNMSIKRLR